MTVIDPTVVALTVRVTVVVAAGPELDTVTLTKTVIPVRTFAGAEMLTAISGGGGGGGLVENSIIEELV